MLAPLTSVKKVLTPLTSAKKVLAPLTLAKKVLAPLIKAIRCWLLWHQTKWCWLHWYKPKMCWLLWHYQKKILAPMTSAKRSWLLWHQPNIYNRQHMNIGGKEWAYKIIAWRCTYSTRSFSDLPYNPFSPVLILVLSVIIHVEHLICYKYTKDKNSGIQF